MYIVLSTNEIIQINHISFFVVSVLDTNFVETTDVLLLPGNKTTIHWPPNSIVEPHLQEVLSLPNNYSVDISLYQLNVDSENYTFIMKLATDIPNSGTHEITVPSLDQPVDMTAGIIGVSIAEQFSTRPTRNIKLIASLLRKAGVLSLGIAIRSIKTSLVLRGLCAIWLLSEPNNIGDIISKRLPPCPPDIRRALKDTSTFKEESRLSISIFHPGAYRCFRQISGFIRFIIL